MFNSRHDIRDYDSSFADGVWESLRATFISSFILSIFISMTYRHASILEFPLLILSVISYMALITGVITLAFSMTVVYLIFIILRFFNMDNELNTALYVGLLLFVLMMLKSSGSFKSVYYIVIMCSMICGYAFAKGYKS